MRASRQGLDLVVAAALLATAATVWVSAGRIPSSFLDSGFGAGYLPRLLAVGIALLAFLLGAEAARERASPALVARFGVAARPALLLALLLGFVGALQYRLVGFYPASLVFVFAGVLVLTGASARRALVAAVIALGSVGVVYVLFTHVFLVIVP